MNPALHRARSSFAASLLVLSTLGACSAVQGIAEVPGKVTKALLPGQAAPDKRVISELHPEVLRLADFAMNHMRRAAAAFEEQAGTPEAQVQALEWRLMWSRTVLERATGPVPLLNMLDLLVSMKVGRRMLESGSVAADWGESVKPLLAAVDKIEQREWQVLEQFFSTEQLDGLRQTFSSWEETQREQGPSSLESVPTFSEITRALGSEKSDNGGFLGFIQLDPLAGLEPVAREVALSRQFAERLFFWTQRLPMLIDDQVALATIQAQELPEVQQVLADVQRVSKAADSISKTAAGLPDQLSAEREAALNQAADEIGALRDSTLKQVSDELTAQREATLTQLSAEITAQRAGLVQDLETAQQPLQSMLGESRSTLEAAQQTSAELRALVEAVGVFLDRFQEPEGAAPEPAAPPARPFDITEYGEAVTRLGQTAGELRELVGTLDQSLPKVQEMVDIAATRGEQTLDHAFRRGLVLGLVLIGAAAVLFTLARLLVQRLGRRAA